MHGSPFESVVYPKLGVTGTKRLAVPPLIPIINGDVPLLENIAAVDGEYEMLPPSGVVQFHKSALSDKLKVRPGYRLSSAITDFIRLLL
jgi:hypothetical protein